MPRDISVRPTRSWTKCALFSRVPLLDILLPIPFRYASLFKEAFSLWKNMEITTPGQTKGMYMSCDYSVHLSRNNIRISRRCGVECKVTSQSTQRCPSGITAAPHSDKIAHLLKRDSIYQPWPF